MLERAWQVVVVARAAMRRGRGCFGKHLGPREHPGGVRAGPRGADVDEL